jgi:hypothetical protein
MVVLALLCVLLETLFFRVCACCYCLRVDAADYLCIAWLCRQGEVRILFVKGVSHEVGEQQIRELFGPAVEKVVLPLDKMDGHRLGYSTVNHSPEFMLCFIACVFSQQLCLHQTRLCSLHHTTRC